MQFAIDALHLRLAGSTLVAVHVHHVSSTGTSPESGLGLGLSIRRGSIDAGETTSVKQRREDAPDDGFEQISAAGAQCIILADHGVGFITGHGGIRAGNQSQQRLDVYL